MDLAEFSQAMAGRGCMADPDGRTFCGTYEDYPFTSRFVAGKPGKNTRFLLAFQFQQKVKGKFFRAIARQMKGVATLSRATYNQGAAVGAGMALGGAVGAAMMSSSQGGYVPVQRLQMVVTVKGNQPFDAAFDALVATVTATAREQAYTVNGNCPLCKQHACDAWAHVNGAYVPVHGACVQNHAAQRLAKVQQNELRGSVALGILGAVLGAVVGSLPMVLVVYFLDAVYGLLCALIPLGAYYGYKLLGGKMNKAVLPVVILASILVVPIAYYLTQALWLWADVGYFLHPLEFIAVLVEYPTEFLLDMGLYLFFTLIGIAIASGVISRSNKHEWNEAAFSAATLRPMQGTAVPPQPVQMQPPVQVQPPAGQ